MADWKGRGGGRKSSHPPAVSGTGGPGRGGGRGSGQSKISSRGSWVGHGKGRPSGQPQIAAPTLGGFSPQAAALKLASMAAYELRDYILGVHNNSWEGRGKGRKGPQASIKPGSLLGARSQASTKHMLSQTGGKVDQHIADPEGAYVFCLEIDGIEVAQFLECSGLKTSTTVFELEEGGMNHRVHKLPGQSKWENITLRYGVTGDVSLLGWRGDIIQDNFGSSVRKNGAIVVKNNQMEVVRRYNFQDAWPVSWEGPSFNSQSNELAIEAIELAHNGIEITAVK
jgi:phage tail-like protein